MHGFRFSLATLFGTIILLAAGLAGRCLYATRDKQDRPAP
jgi:hypothetical protein